MKMEQLSESTRKYLEDRAKKCHITPEEVLRHFEELFARGAVSRHSRLLTGKRVDF